MQVSTLIMNIEQFRTLIEEAPSDKKFMKECRLKSIAFDNDELDGSVCFYVRTKNFEYHCEAFDNEGIIVAEGVLTESPFEDVDKILDDDLQYIEPFELTIDDSYSAEDLFLEIANQINDTELLRKFRKYKKYFDMFSDESSQDLENILKIGDYIR